MHLHRQDCCIHVPSELYIEGSINLTTSIMTTGKWRRAPVFEIPISVVYRPRPHEIGIIGPCHLYPICCNLFAVPQGVYSRPSLYQCFVKDPLVTTRTTSIVSILIRSFLLRFSDMKEVEEQLVKRKNARARAVGT